MSATPETEPKTTTKPKPRLKPKPKTTSGKKKQPVAVETSLSIEEQTKAFLESGGEIEQINSGVSGQQSMAGPRHITLGNKPRSN